MKHTKRTSCLSMILVLAMLATCFVAFSVTSSAELATELPTSWGAELPEGAVAWGSGDMTTASTSLAGSGTEADPYLIANVADFMYFANTAAAAATAENYFKMTGDVYFPVITDTTTSSRYFAPPDFAGHFDGNGHTIWNPRNTYKANAACSSVFGLLTGATIKNLTVKGAFFSQMYIANDTACAAGLAKEIQTGTISNCHVVDAYLAGSRIGGIVQSASGKVEISGCTVSGTFAPTLAGASSCFGGILGNIWDKKGVITADITITNCENHMSCASDTNYFDVGGILGFVKKTASSVLTIRDCKNYGSYNNSTTATDSSSNDGKGIGGIIGRVYKSVSVTLSGCQNHGNLTAPNNVGGMVGLFAPDSSISLLITQCVNKGNITATGQDAGGLVGAFGTLYSSNYLAQDCANYGNIQATDFAGGYIGSVMQGGSPGKSTKNNTVKCVSFANYGSITATNKFAGQIVGFYCRGMNSTSAPNNIVATNSVLTGKVSATACAGSICGGYTTIESDATVFNITLTGCYVSCDITKPTGSGVPDRSGAIAGAWLTTDTEVAGTFYDTTGLTLKSTDSKFHVTLNGATPASDYFVTTDGVAGGQTITDLDKDSLGTAFTDGTALAALNTYARDNKLGAWVQGTNAPELESFYQAPTAVQVTLDGATLALGDTMTLKFFVKASSVSEITDLATIVVNDGTKDYAGALDAETNSYVFEITDLAAKDMGTAKTYTVKYTLSSDTANPITCSEGVEYSPLQYAINMYEKNAADTTPNANFAALLTSMVRYMDAAGVTGAKTTFAAKTGYTFDDTTVNTDYAAIVAKDAESTFDFPEGTAELGAELTSGITLIVKPAEGKTFNDVSVKIGDKELAVETADGTWRVTGINPGDLYNELTFTITTNEGTVTGTYSIARYLNSYMDADLENETAIETLAKVTALYMNAFITYKTATN